MHKLMDREEQEDTSEAGILDRFHEYTDEDEANAPPGQQGGEKLDPQQKSFFTDVQHVFTHLWPYGEIQDLRPLLPLCRSSE